MKYYLIAGEASGDIHAANLMRELKKIDTNAEFRYYGGDLMRHQGGTLVCHYKNLAYMGFIPVLLHLRTILQRMKSCKSDILSFRPHALILIDYPGFNLSIAQFVHKRSRIPIFYYISPKIWAWKEYRIKNIKRDVTALFSILPFEIDFYEKKHHYPIHYVGNPTLDEVEEYKKNSNDTLENFEKDNQLSHKPTLALLAGSRKQEIESNLPIMLRAAQNFSDKFNVVIAAAPSISRDYYNQYLNTSDVKILYNQTYRILSHSSLAMVTSGTATLETCLFGVPQVVCYYLRCGRLVSILRKMLLKVKYISLVNLIAGKEVVRELVADDMNVSNLTKEISQLLPGTSGCENMLREYKKIATRLGSSGAPGKAAALMVEMLKRKTDMRE